MKEKYPLLSKEHLHRMNHFSRVTYLELAYATYCVKLRDGEITREFFDKQTQKITALLGDAEWLKSGQCSRFGARYTSDDMDMISERWKQVAERQQTGEVLDEEDIPNHHENPKG